MNTNTDIIQLAGFGQATLTATDWARAERDLLLGMARDVENVRDAQTAEKAATALRSLKDFTRNIEAARTSVKLPVLDLGKRIDTLAKELTTTLETEADRLSRALGAWNTEQKRLAEEAERKAREEEQRIWREAQEKEAAEKARLQKEAAEREAKAKAERDELLRRAERARSEAGKQRALEQAEALRIQQQIAEDDRKAAEEHAARERNEQAGKAMVAARVSAPAPVAAPPPGVATRREIQYEVLDIQALYKALPHLCIITENRLLLKDYLKRLPAGTGSVPGVRFWLEAKTSVR